MSRPPLSIFPERRREADWAPADAYGATADPAAREEDIEQQIQDIVNELAPDHPDHDQDAR